MLVCKSHDHSQVKGHCHGIVGQKQHGDTIECTYNGGVRSKIIYTGFKRGTR